MVDGFHWMRVTAKQLRFIYDEVTLQKPPLQMLLLAQLADAALISGASGFASAMAIEAIAEGTHPANADNVPLVPVAKTGT